MTTDDKTLTEQIAYAVHDMRVVDKHPGDDNHPFNIAAAVLPIIRKAQAEAWDRGEAAGYYNTGPRWKNSNPYRTEQTNG